MDSAQSTLTTLQSVRDRQFHKLAVQQLRELGRLPQHSPSIATPVLLEHCVAVVKDVELRRGLTKLLDLRLRVEDITGQLRRWPVGTSHGRLLKSTMKKHEDAFKKHAPAVQNLLQLVHNHQALAEQMGLPTAVAALTTATGQQLHDLLMQLPVAAGAGEPPTAAAAGLAAGRGGARPAAGAGAAGAVIAASLPVMSAVRKVVSAARLLARGEEERQHLGHSIRHFAARTRQRSLQTLQNALVLHRLQAALLARQSSSAVPALTVDNYLSLSQRVLDSVTGAEHYKEAVAAWRRAGVSDTQAEHHLRGWALEAGGLSRSMLREVVILKRRRVALADKVPRISACVNMDPHTRDELLRLLTTTESLHAARDAANVAFREHLTSLGLPPYFADDDDNDDVLSTAGASDIERLDLVARVDQVRRMVASAPAERPTASPLARASLDAPSTRLDPVGNEVWGGRAGGEEEQNVVEVVDDEEVIGVVAGDDGEVAGADEGSDSGEEEVDDFLDVDYFPTEMGRVQDWVDGDN